MENVLNFLPSFVLWGSAITFWIVVGVLTLILFASENAENGYFAFVSFLIFGVGNYFFGNFNMLDILSLSSVGIYLGVGFVYALIRTYIYGSKNKTLSKGYIGERLKENVFRWWFMFPVSFIYWVFSDLVSDVYDFLYKRLEKLFYAVFLLGAGNSGKEEENKK